VLKKVTTSFPYTPQNADNVNPAFQEKPTCVQLSEALKDRV